jgi:hypothetical protein
MASHPAGEAPGREAPAGPAAGRPRAEALLPARDVVAAVVESIGHPPSSAPPPSSPGFTLFRLFPAVTALPPPAFHGACEPDPIHTPQAGARPCE